LSYEQPDWHEAVEATYSVSSKFSFSTRKNSYDPKVCDFPLSSLNDIGNYVHGTSSGNRGGIWHDSTTAGRKHHGMASQGIFNSDHDGMYSSSDLIGKGAKGYGRPGLGSDLTPDYQRDENFYSEGRGRPEIVTAYGDGSSLRLEGKTEAIFDGGSFKTAGVKLQESEGCSCTEDKCIRARGKLNARYAVRTKVTLPSVSDYPDLSSPQKKRLQTTINTILAPHEQKHVAAFRKYNGTTSRPFDLTICKGEFESAIQSMFDEEQAARREAAQEESDALDPFLFEFEL
jgi:hypothetical protein